jgi:hypothetical protein
MRIKVAALLFLSTAPAFAQAPQPPQHQATPSEQALGQKLFQEIQSGIACSSNLFAVQADLVKAQARIKELETPSADKPAAGVVP